MTDRAGPFLTPGAWLTGFMKKTFIHVHCYMQNMKALGLVHSDKKIFFMIFPLQVYGSYNDPRGGAIFDLGAWLAGFIKRTT